MGVARGQLVHEQGQSYYEVFMKRLVHRTLQRAGWEVMRYPPLPAPNRETATHLKMAMEACPVDGVIDVGAHRGGFVNVLREEVGYSGPVVSFEPMRANYEALARSRGKDRAWSGHNIALGSAAGSLSLNVFEGTKGQTDESGATSFNSFHEANEYGRKTFGAFFGSRRVEKVSVRRLDEVLDLPGRLMLKSDTQGYDMEVLKGSTSILPRVMILCVELSVRPIYEGMPSLLETLSVIDSLGFEWAGLSEVSRDGARVIEYDAVFIRSEC